MRTLACQACGAERPMGEMFDIHGRTLCQACGKQFLGGREEDARGVAQRYVDPTVCVNCGADNGTMPHETLAQLPTCARCIAFYRNRPFPAWVKAALAATLLLVGVSLAWNWRFFQAHFELKAALRSSDLDESARLASAATGHVPESGDLKELASFYQGVLCLRDDKCDAAESHFMRCSHLPARFGVSEFLDNAKMGAAFERKNYDRFLELAQAAVAREPNNPMAHAQAASALACLYATRGDLRFKHDAEAKLMEAKRLNLDAVETSHYEDRIRFRLETREIIDRQEFASRFPNGWKPPGDPKR